MDHGIQTHLCGGSPTGTYTSQSAQVLGIIKNMRDTFEANLADARETEKNAVAAHKEFMKIKKEAFDEMSNLGCMCGNTDSTLCHTIARPSRSTGRIFESPTTNE